MDTSLNLGSQALARGDLAGAEAEFRKALSLFKYLPEAHLGLARVQRRAGKLPEAIQALQNAIAMDRTYLEARLELAGCYDAAPDPGRARSTLEQVLRIDPFNADAEHELALVLEKQALLLLARTHHRRAYVLAPNRYGPKYDGLVQAQLVRPKPMLPGAPSPEPKRETQVSELLEQVELGNVALLAGRLERSIQTQNLASRVMPKSAADPTWTVEGSVLVTALEGALEGNPYDLAGNALLAAAYSNRALVHVKNKDTQGAVTEYLRALNRRTGSAGALNGMSYLEADPQSAAFLLRRSILLGGDADRETLQRLQSLWPAAVPQSLPKPAPGEDCVRKAYEAMKQERWAEAEPLLKACIEASPSADWVDGAYAFLGRLYYGQKDVDRAELFLRRSVESAPDKWAYYGTWANALYLAGNKEAAVTVTRLALKYATDESIRKSLQQNLPAYR